MVDTSSGVVGPSVGKAIALIAANAKSKGTGTAKLWEIWKTYKDVAHLVTAAVLVAAEAQTRHRSAPYGLKLHQFQPYRMAMLLPELVISVAMTIEDYGLQQVAHGRTEPMFDPELLWRIPADINLTPVAPPVRKITKKDRRRIEDAACRQSRARPIVARPLQVLTGSSPQAEPLKHRNDIRRARRHRARRDEDLLSQMRRRPLAAPEVKRDEQCVRSAGERLENEMESQSENRTADEILHRGSGRRRPRRLAPHRPPLAQAR